MVLPLLMLAAGILAQDQAKRKALGAQQGALGAEQQNQNMYRGQVAQQIQRNFQANGIDTRQATDDAQAGRLNQANGTAQANALKMFAGAGGNASVADAGGGVAAKRFAAGDALAAPGLGNQARRRLGMDVSSNIEGIRQRSQRSLGMLPAKLDYAATSGQTADMVGKLLASYGYGGTAAMLTAHANKIGGQVVSPSTTTAMDDPSTPGAADLWGDNAAAAVA